MSEWRRGRACFLPVAAVAVLMASRAAAQVDDRQAIIVTGSRTGLEARQIGSAVTVVNAEAIESDQILLVKDILQDVPGVQISNDRPGAVTGVYLRGADNDQVLVLLDGIELGDPSNISTQFQFDHLNASDIERIEILRGNQSSLYGSDAIGGVINIITRKPPEAGIDVGVDAETGAFGQRRLGAAVSADAGLIDYRFSTDSLALDGPSRADPKVGPADEDDAYSRTGFDGRLGFQVSSRLRLQLNGFRSDTRTDLDGSGQDATTTPGIDKAESAYALGLTREGARGRWHHELGYSRYGADRLYPASGDRLSGEKENLKYTSVLSPSDRISLAFGMDLERERTDQLTSFSGSFVAANATDSLFAELALTPVDPLTLTFAARGDDNDRFGYFGTHRITAAYRLAIAGPEAKLRASWGTGAKAPGLYQLFDPSFGDTGLGVEQSHGYDVGADLFWPGGAQIELSYFATRIENEIDFEWPVGYLNLGGTRAAGIETYFSVPIGERIDWSLSYTYLASYDTRTDAWFGRPRNTASARLSLQATDRLGLGARARYRSRNAASFGGETPGFVVVDLLGNFELGERIEIYGRIVNLFDRDYEYEWGSSTYGRSVFAGIRLRY